MPEISRFYGIVIKMFLKAQALIKEWLKINQKELLEMWDSQKLRKLPPL